MSSYIPQTGTVPPPSAQGVSGSLPGQQAVNTTKILSLTGFSKELKTRDIQAIFVDYEEDRGGYRIKWLDDTGCLIVFNDAGTAKRAFVDLLANPHPHLRPSFDPENPTAPSATVPVLAPYNEEDAPSIIAGVSTRPRSRSIANNNANGSNSGTPSGHHGRRMSNTSGNHASLANGGSSGSPGQNGGSGQPDLGRKTSRTFSRPSAQMPAIPDDSAVSPTQRSASPPSPTSKDSNGNNGGAIDWKKYQAQQRERAMSGSSNGPGGNAFSPPTSPDKGLAGRAGAHSPTAFRRMVAQRQQ